MKLFLLALSCLFCCTLSAQRNYVPASITTSQNDSISGFIDYRNWSASPSVIRFKQSLTDEKEQQFGPGEIKAFHIANPDEIYISRKLVVDISAQVENYVGNYAELEMIDTLVFLRLLVPGKHGLYIYTDKHERHHFFYNTDSDPQTMTELEYVKKFVSTNSTAGIYEDKKYRTQLATLFADNRAIVRRSNNISYSEDALSKLFAAYNNYSNPEGEQIVLQKQKGIARFGVMAGAGFSKFNMGGQAYVFKNSTYSSSVTPVAGIFLDLASNRNRRQFSLINELLYKVQKTDGKLKDGSTTKFNVSYLSLNTMFRYTYPEGRVRPYANAGLSNALIVSISKNEFHRYTGSISEAIDGMRKHELSLVAGAGVQISKFSVECRFVGGSGFSPYAGSYSKVRTGQLLLGYYF